MILGFIILSSVGITLLIMGWLIWKKEKINLFHEYHYDKVTEENKKAFCSTSGKGIFIIGLGIFLSGIISLFTDSPWSLLGFAIGFVVGLGFVIYSGIKYNR